MSTITVNLSARDVLEHLNLELPAKWTSDVNELDVVCINSPAMELGFIATLNVVNGVYSFTCTEFASDTKFGNDHEETNEFPNYESLIAHIQQRVEFYKGE